MDIVKPKKFSRICYHFGIQFKELMKSIEKLSKLADKFEAKLNKYGQAQVADQPSTTTLFFGVNQGTSQAFASAVQNQNGPTAKYLVDLATKTQKTASFDLKTIATPGKGASWLLTVVPPNAKGIVSKLLDAEFQKVMKIGMATQQASADKAAKAGGGTGTNNIASFSADMD